MQGVRSAIVLAAGQGIAHASALPRVWGEELGEVSGAAVDVAGAQRCAEATLMRFFTLIVVLALASCGTVTPASSGDAGGGLEAPAELAQADAGVRELAAEVGADQELDAGAELADGGLEAPAGVRCDSNTRYGGTFYSDLCESDCTKAICTYRPQNSDAGPVVQLVGCRQLPVYNMVAGGCQITVGQAGPELVDCVLACP